MHLVVVVHEPVGQQSTRKRELLLARQNVVAKQAIDLLQPFLPLGDFLTRAANRLPQPEVPGGRIQAFFRCPTTAHAGTLTSRIESTEIHDFMIRSRPMQRWYANLVLLIAGATWGMGFVAQSTAMASIGPFLFIALRFFVASLTILPFAAVESRRHARTGQPGLTAAEWRRFGLIGLCLFAGMAAQQVGLLTTRVTNSGFLTGLYVVITPMLGILLFREIPHRITWLAAIVSVSGIYLLSGGELGQLTTGDILTIVSAVCWALQMVLIARFVGQSGRPLALSMTQFMVTAVLALMVTLSIETIDWAAVVAVAPQILYAGIFASGFAFTLQVIGQRYTSAAQAAIFLSSEAPFAALFAYFWLDERLSTLGLAGCGLIFIAMLAVELFPPWSARRAARRAVGQVQVG